MGDQSPGGGEDPLSQALITYGDIEWYEGDGEAIFAEVAQNPDEYESRIDHFDIGGYPHIPGNNSSAFYTQTLFQDNANYAGENAGGSDYPADIKKPGLIEAVDADLYRIIK